MRQRLGEILVRGGVIDAHTLQAALAEAASTGGRVGEILVARGDCTEEAILEALAGQLGVEVAPLSTTVMVPARVLRLVPAELARERLVLPLFLDAAAGVLEVAMADPADDELLDELRFRTGHRIRPLVALASELGEAVEQLYPEVGDGDGGMRRRQPTPTVRVARTGDLPTPLVQPAPMDEGSLHARLETAERRVIEVEARLRLLATSHAELVASLAQTGVLNAAVARRLGGEPGH